jgi:hypothetical protein
MRRAAVALLCLAACGARPSTALRVTVEIRPGDPAPTKLSVSVWDAHHALVRGAALAPGPLPGTVRISGLPDVDQLLRVVVASDPATHELGYARVNVRAHVETPTTLLLSAATADRDGDGVPDDIDDCPDVPDPDQSGAACAPDGGDGGDLPDGGERNLMSDLGGVFCGAAVSPCGTGSAVSCQGFESGGISAPWGTVLTPTGGGATYVVDGQRACRGNFSLHLSTPAIAAGAVGRAFAWEHTLAPAQQGDLFIRGFFWIEQSATGGTLITVYQNASPYQEIDFVVGQSGLAEIHNSVTPRFAAGTLMFPTGRWVCVEMEVLSSTTSGAVNVWVDEQLTVQETGIVTQPAAPITNIGMGVFYYQPAAAVPARDLFVDEIVIDSQRIGCSR